MKRFRPNGPPGHRTPRRPTRNVCIGLGLIAVGLTSAGAPIAGAAEPGPRVAITSPAPSDTVAETVQLTASASDPQGVLRVNFFVDGVQVAADTTAPYAAVWDASTAPVGSHQVKVAAFDASPERNKTVLTQTVTVTEAPAQPDGMSDATVLWRDDTFCSRKTLHPGVGLCAEEGPWDVTACVPGTAEEPVWSLKNLAGGIGRFEVRPGDQGADGGGDRCEIIQQTRSITGMTPPAGRAATPGGEIRFFAFDAMYDASLQDPSSAQYQTVAQWHQSTNAAGCPTSSPLKIAVAGPSGAKRLEVQAQECSRGATSPRRILLSEPLETDSWHRWVFEIKWSPLPSVGYVRIWHNGAIVQVPGCESDGRCMIATRYSDDAGNVPYYHFKLGNYRDKTIQQATAVSYRNVVIAAGD